MSPRRRRERRRLMTRADAVKEGVVPDEREGPGRRINDRMVVLLVAVCITLLMVSAAISVAVLRNAQHITDVERGQRVAGANVDRKNARRDLAFALRRAFTNGCHRSRAVDVSINKGYERFAALTLEGIPQVRKFVAEGTLTPAQGERAIESSRLSAAEIRKLKVKLPNCAKIVSAIPVR